MFAEYILIGMWDFSDRWMLRFIVTGVRGRRMLDADGNPGSGWLTA
jgi:hypothetical protein